MTRTITLDGTEERVENLGGRNVMIVNNSDSSVYASRYPNVTPYEDNVIEIRAGARDTVEDADGTIYVIGTGKVELRGVDYVGFKQPSSSNGGGGGKVCSSMTIVADVEAIVTTTEQEEI